jgi:hypothetical protein
MSFNNLSKIIPYILVILVIQEALAQTQWTWRNPLPCGADLNAIIWAGNQYVAVGAGGTVLSSPDGVAWTVSTAEGEGLLRSVTWTGSLYVAVGRENISSRGVLLTSTDGKKWIKKNLPLCNDFTSVVWTGTSIFAFTDYEEAWISQNGDIWEKYLSPDQITIKSVVWTGEKLVGLNRLNAYTSTDGKNWTKHIIPGSEAFNNIMWTGSSLLAVGEHGKIVSSNNGIDWKISCEGFSISGNTDLYTSVWTGTQFVAIGDTLLYSADGVQWSGQGVQWNNQLWPSNPFLRAAVWANNKICAVGYLGQIEISSDGKIWNGSTTSLSGPSFEEYSIVVWMGDKFIIPKDDNTILTSADGKTWNKQPSDHKARFSSLIWTGTYLVGVGGSVPGVIMSSLNGIQWESHPSGVDKFLFSICYTGNGYCAVGDSGTILTSPDLVQWTSHPNIINPFLLPIDQYPAGVYQYVVELNSQISTGTIIISR